MSHPDETVPIAEGEQSLPIDASAGAEPPPPADQNPSAEPGPSPARSRRADTQRALWILCTLALLLAI